ncbi:MAG: hypothetical protein Q8L09_05175 [Candidatus Moranbacteria bacterium]|nr:hypothetical protein [Candidatus Moranbacteria bacterium]
MKKIISLAVFLVPLSTLASVQPESEQTMKDAILWFFLFLLSGSALTLIGYLILFFFTKIKRKKLIIISIVMLIISILVIFFYVSINSLVSRDSASQF